MTHGGHDAHLVDAGRLLRRARAPGHRRQRRQLRRAGHAARVRAGRLAGPARTAQKSRPCRSFSTRRCARGARPLDHARQPRASWRSRPTTWWSFVAGRETPRRNLFVAHPQRRDGGFRCRQGGHRIGRRAEIPVDIIHLKIADQSLWGRMPEIVGIDRRSPARVESTSRPTSIPTLAATTTWSASSPRGPTKEAPPG